MKNRSIHKPGAYLVIIAILLIVTFSFFNIDFSGITISQEFIQPIIDGMLNPEWAFVNTGGSEDLISLLIVTISIGLLGTLIGAIIALPLSFLAAKNLWHEGSLVPKFGKFLFDVLRSFPELVYAIVFVRVVGPGPFAGVLAIGVSQIGMLGKLFAESMEALPEDSVESMEAVGANFWQTMVYARLPILNPIYSSYILNHFEIAVRSAAVLGLVGAGGIGAPLVFAIQARRWPRVSIILLGIILLVFVIDAITGYVRKRLR